MRFSFIRRWFTRRTALNCRRTSPTTLPVVQDLDDGGIPEGIAKVRAQVGDGKVIRGLSGGVDSPVVAVLLHEAIGISLPAYLSIRV